MDEISTSNPKSQITKPLDANSPINTVHTTMDKFLSAAHVEAVYGVPIRQGENIIIPAAEILSSAGFGVGSGSGPQGNGENENTSINGGGGGGGHVVSRPVAAIVISPNSVRVEPIVDVTKIVLAALTALGFMMTMLNRMSNTKPPNLSD